jgi:hypothetical protein
MKTSATGIVLAATLAVVVAVGLGIAQAGEYPSDSQAWTLQDQGAVEQYNDFMVGPIETGNLPEPHEAGSSLGFAQTEGNLSESPLWTVQDQEEVEQYNDYMVGPAGH